MSDGREPLGRIAHGIYRDWLAEQVQRMYGDSMQAGSWDDLTDSMREAYMRIGSAVAARAVADAVTENLKRDAQLFAFGVHMPAILDALRIAAADSEYRARARRFRDALTALGGDES